MAYNNLTNYYFTMNTFRFHHKYSDADIYAMYPFERDIEIELIAQHIKELEEAKRNS